MATDTEIEKVEKFLQFVLEIRSESFTTAVDAARWLDAVGLLKDSRSRPGKPLRDLLRAGKIKNARQENNHRWFIDRA